MLKKLLSSAAASLDPAGITTPEEAIRLSGELLARAGKATKAYSERMIEAYRSLGSYIVLSPGIAFPHARPGNDVLDVGVSFVRLPGGVTFGHEQNDPVTLIFALCSPNNDAHIELLSSLSRLLSTPETLVYFKNAKTHDELISKL
jgi:Phosphotransferase system mannitol/fructose-specific IIA domain (Ntr-type)